METIKSGRTGVKHTEPRLIELKNYVHLRYNTSTGGLFRLPKGKSPMVAVRAIQHNEIVLVECLYLVSGRISMHLGDREVVPLKLGTFKDDNDYKIIEAIDYYERQ